MEENIVEIFDGVKLHFINTDKFKTDLMAVFLITDLNRENVTKNALIPAVLRRGTNNVKTMKAIAMKLENMYGSVFDASSDKIGDRQVIQFYINSLNNNYALDSMDIQTDAATLLCDIILNPKLVDGIFDSEYVESEKDTLRELIESKINDKGAYALDCCIEKMCQNEPFGLYKFGYTEDLESINAGNLYMQYKEVLKTAEIHIYVSGELASDKLENIFKERFGKIERDFKETKLQTFLPVIEKNDFSHLDESLDVTQGKIVMGYRVCDIDLKEDLAKATLLSTVLGGTPSSKLFQNVREKASLAYTIRSSYFKHKGILMISAGIEIDKYDEAFSLILKQVEDIKNGDVTQEELADAKSYLINNYKSFYDDQSTIINFDMGQTLLENDDSIEELIKKINDVEISDIVEIANKLRCDTTYFLKNSGEVNND